MGLRDLKTDFKSLKYGKDVLGGGDSGQPYIQVDINTGERTVKKDEDGYIRGGTSGAANASTTDLLRIKRFINSKPKGYLFITKQIGLQYSNPKLETKKVTIGGNSGVARFANNLISTVSSNFGPTRIYNLGINTLAQIPVNALGIHLTRHGLTPVQDDQTKYLSVVKFNNENNSNRLEALQTKFQLGDRVTTTINTSSASQLISKISTNLRQIGGFIGGLFGTKTSTKINQTINRITKAVSLFNNNTELIIDDYIGGPGSTYGIGKTIINRYDNTEDATKINFLKELSSLKAKSAKIDWSIGAGLAQNGPSLLNGDDGTFNILNPDVENQNSIKKLSGLSPALKNYTNIQTAVNNLQLSSPKTIPFSTVPDINFKKKKFGPFKNKEFKSETNSGLDRTPDSPFRYYGIAESSGDGSQLIYNNSNMFTRKDADILTVVFRAIDPFTNLPEVNSSQEKARRHAFSAYMKGFKDNFTGNWNEINYAGRAESFYVYDKFKRNVSFNLQIPCFNRKELFEKHRNLGQMAATTAGAYSDKNTLGGVLIQINLGNYLVGEYGILNNLSYNIPDDASWDVTPEGRLAMLIEASFDFTIVHKKLPQYEVDGGFFGYLPNQTSGFLPTVSNVDEFVYNNYETFASGDTRVPNAVVRLNPSDIPPVTGARIKNTTGGLSTVSTNLQQVNLRTSKTPKETQLSRSQQAKADANSDPTGILSYLNRTPAQIEADKFIGPRE